MNWLSIFIAHDGSLLDRILDYSIDRYKRKPEKPLSRWFLSTRDTWLSINNDSKEKRRYYMSWFFTNIFNDLWELFENCINRE